MRDKCCFVDTSAFIALNNRNDQYHEAAVDIAKRLENYQFFLSDAVITETYTLLRYKLGYHVAHNFLLNLVENNQFQIIDVTPKIRKDTLSLLEKFNDQKISYCDALTVVSMRSHQIEHIFTFDVHFEIMGVHRFE